MSTAVTYCGQVGDPALAPDVMEITDYLTYHGLTVYFSTNGSIRSPDWWQELPKYGRNLLSVTWHPDSLKPNNNLYRIGSNTEKVLENMKAYNAAGGRSCWRMIIFDHNKDEIDDQMNKSLELECENFVAIYGNGFEILNEYTVKNNGKSHVVRTAKPEWKWDLENDPTEIRCRALVEMSLEVTAAGIVVPCCYFPNGFRRVYSNFYIDRNNTDPILDDERYTDELRYKYFVQDFVPVIEKAGGIKSLWLEENSFEDIIDKHPFFTHETEKTWNKFGLCSLACASKNNQAFWEMYFTPYFDLPGDKRAAMRKKLYQQKRELMMRSRYKKLI
jgi:MoaA/NifB/PqqE/SkfB family radical SAM enzyme